MSVRAYYEQSITSELKYVTRQVCLSCVSVELRRPAYSTATSMESAARTKKVDRYTDSEPSLYPSSYVIIVSCLFTDFWSISVEHQWLQFTLHLKQDYPCPDRSGFSLDPDVQTSNRLKRDSYTNIPPRGFLP
jgi:hypothetical protein